MLALCVCLPRPPAFVTWSPLCLGVQDEQPAPAAPTGFRGVLLPNLSDLPAAGHAMPSTVQDEAARSRVARSADASIHEGAAAAGLRGTVPAPIVGTRGRPQPADVTTLGASSATSTGARRHSISDNHVFEGGGLLPLAPPAPGPQTVPEQADSYSWCTAMCRVTSRHMTHLNRLKDASNSHCYNPLALLPQPIDIIKSR